MPIPNQTNNARDMPRTDSIAAARPSSEMAGPVRPRRKMHTMVRKSKVLFTEFNFTSYTLNDRTQADVGFNSSTTFRLDVQNNDQTDIWVIFEGCMQTLTETLDFSLTQKFVVDEHWTDVSQVNPTLKQSLNKDVLNVFVSKFNRLFPESKLMVVETFGKYELKSL